MADTIPFVPDTVPVIQNGVLSSKTPAQLIAAFSSNSKTPTKNFSVHFNGHTLSFQKNVPFVTTPDLLAALTAQNAPIV
jgi:hypothetical protein